MRTEGLPLPRGGLDRVRLVRHLRGDLVAAGSQARARPARSLVHALVLASVFATFATSGVVFSEPAPVDALMLGLMILLPTVGLARLTPAIVVYVSAWLVCEAFGFVAATASFDVAKSVTHTSVSLFLALGSAVIAAFVAARPVDHARLILVASALAATGAAVTGIAGYFNAFPGAFDLFTRYGRATGTFKDPNVFGPFLVAGFLTLLHVALTRSALAAAGALGLAGVLALGVLLSFSRGAWFALAVATISFAVLSFITAASAAERRRLITMGLVSLALVVAVGILALQIEQVRDALENRASLTQSYDVGPEGRFGGQQKALALIAANPFGIGAGQFAGVYHNEEVHNVYLSMLLNNGWIGGLLYALIMVVTLAAGAWQMRRAFPARPLLVIAYCAFLGNVLESFIIDSDHWRHLYLMMGLVWGMIGAGVGIGGGGRGEARAAPGGGGLRRHH